MLTKNYRIDVAGLEKGSAHIVLTVFEWVKDNPTAAGVLLTGATIAVRGAAVVVQAIAKSISAKKHTEGGAPTNVTFNGPVVMLNNSHGVALEMSKQDYALLNSGVLDPDLDKLTAPLHGEQVNKFELKVGRQTLTDVTSKERVFFQHTTRTVTSSRDDVWMEGTLNSLSKDRNRGTFHTLNGKHISYRYIGNDQQLLIRAFAHKGLVRARGKVQFDADLNPTAFEIDTVELMQRTMFSSD